MAQDIVDHLLLPGPTVSSHLAWCQPRDPLVFYSTAGPHPFRLQPILSQRLVHDRCGNFQEVQEIPVRLFRLSCQVPLKGSPALDSLVSSINLMRVYSTSSSSPLIKMLNRIGPNAYPKETPPVTGLKPEEECPLRLTIQLGSHPSHPPVWTIMCQSTYKKDHRKQTGKSIIHHP